MKRQELGIYGPRRWLIAQMVVLVFGFQGAHAQQATCINEEQGTSFYFVNGVMTDFVSASLSTQMLSRALEAEGILQSLDRVSVAYNPTGSPIVDLVESLAQDIQTDIGPSLNALGQTAYDLAYRAVILGISTALPNSISFLSVRESAIRAVVDLNQDVIGQDEVDQHIARYRSDLLAGEKVLLVAHSQGNFFANLAFANLTDDERSSVGIVSVANPDSQVGLQECEEVSPGTVDAFEVTACSRAGAESTWLSCPNGIPRYTTVCRDSVVNELRSSLFDIRIRPALPPNWFGPGGLDEEDSYYHGFRTVYLRADAAGGTTTRNRILNQVRVAESELEVPLLQGDLAIYGSVLSAENLALIGGARVKVELIADALAGGSAADTLFDAVVDDYTDQAGAYSICVPSRALPATILLTASSERFVPQALTRPNDGGGDLRVDFLLDELTANIVVFESDPLIHHLGDDNASGDINSQFQKLSEGIVYETSFFLTEEQRLAQTATLTLLARGLQENNPLQINGETVAFLNSSPPDGSFGEVSVMIPMGFFDLESGVQVLRIESAPGLLLDRDDFEFVNILIAFTF